jgi:hypothetical protein
MFIKRELLAARQNLLLDASVVQDAFARDVNDGSAQ